jgi:hypothetical protein
MSFTKVALLRSLSPCNIRGCKLRVVDVAQTPQPPAVTAKCIVVKNGDISVVFSGVKFIENFVTIFQFLKC